MSDDKVRAASTSQPTSGPTATVPKDPQPSVDRIDELARRILTGDILLPKFQRSFVWERPQILTLLDSVARGYPIGSVLLWQSRQELRSESNIADLDIRLPRPDYPVNYLLDGQQRLSAICGAMYWKGDNPHSRWNITYDLRQKKFFHLDTLEDPPLTSIRANKLSDAVAFFKHVASLDTLTSADKDELKANAELLFNRFKDYKIATVTLGDMSIQDVAPIFERINSTGTPLTIVDLMRAATWSPDFDLIDSIEGLLNDLSDKGFDKVDKKVVLRSLSAAAGGGFSAESIDELRNHSAETLKASIDDTREAYKRMVDFLTTQIGVSSAQIVPYSNQLTVLSEVFRRVPTPTAAQYTAISQWFWKTALSGYFGGWNTGQMADDLRSVIEFTEGRADRINVAAVRPSHDIWKVRQFRANNAHAKLLGIVLAHHGPIDLLTGQRIDTTKALSWTNVKEYHHFFPQAFLKRHDVTPNKINCLANFIMLTSASNKVISDRSPSDYLRNVREVAGERLNGWLASNLIPRAAFDAALKDNFEVFLELRAQAIHFEVIAKTDWI
ncbi:MAG TPA: DUF262 domain-containing protein [Pyrinomonadaceae bacterium]|jgi:hypothetical protein|nr:DUF262 domain-containing protein [Pyrinomonadaceae bacterium]